MIKRKRNIRTKINNDEETIAVTSSPTPVVRSETEKEQKKKAKGKGKVALSFGIDEEEQEETFQITKTAASRRLAKLKSKKLHIDYESIPQNSDQPSYTEETLSELRASTPATPASFQSQEIINDFNLGNVFDIPNASAISAAKKEREMRRKKGLSGASDYISLSKDTDIITTSGKKIESRLVREEDELGEADEELERYMNEKLAIGKKAKKEQERLKKADIEEMIMDVDFEDEDDELLQWELEAMKAGGHIPKKSSKRYPDLKQQARIPAIVPVPTLNEVQSRLECQLIDLQELHNNHQTELIQIQGVLDSIASSNAQMETEIQNTKKRYTYFQELKTFVENLVEFLDDKFPILEKLEKDYQDVILEKSRLIMQRIMEDDSDDIALFCMNDNQRRQQRDRRRLLRKNNIPADELKEEGFSTDDELGKSDEIEIAGKIDEISYHRTNLFEDVIEDFKSIASVKSKFMSWKTEFNDDYTKAYGGLSLPGVFEFYVRYEIMLWNTSKVNHMEWYRVISEYSAPESNTSQIGTDDDFTIMSKVFEKIILPRITHLVKTLNPYSSKQTMSFIDIFEKILDHVDRKSQKFQNVVMSLEPIPENINISISDPNSFSIARNRYFWRKYKLLRNLITWKEFIPVDVLRLMSIDYLLNRYLLRILNNSSLKTDSSKFQKILEIVPSDWLPSPSLERIARGAAGF
ncbi:nineteen complex-related protein 2-domain-containing protein [Glomus cerebriforme]|uniref:Nineteen complex-related protein 2-domain-containing protein n=1 Tax=Glomus cerebriforme TaxID=658196 RepID=A0A397T7F5_9GLOM|nr:nineteen complex-related protein 2-domain-containing protein [Glomus cerebriforme]